MMIQDSWWFMGRPIFWLVLCAVLSTSYREAYALSQSTKDLVEARNEERVKGANEDALRLYANVLDDKKATETERQEALAGKIRCLVKLDRLSEAEELYQQTDSGFRRGPYAVDLSFLMESSEPETIRESVTQRRIKALITQLDQSFNDASDAVAFLSAYGDEAVAQLSEALKEPDTNIVSNAFHALDRIRRANPKGPALGVFQSLIDETDPILLSNGLGALTPPLDPSLHVVVSSFQNHPLPLVRSATAPLLLAIGEPENAIERCREGSYMDAIKVLKEGLATGSPHLGDLGVAFFQNPHHAEINYSNSLVGELLKSRPPQTAMFLLCHPELSKRTKAWKELWQRAQWQRGKHPDTYLTKDEDLLSVYYRLDQNDQSRLVEVYLETLANQRYLLFHGAAAGLPFTVEHLQEAFLNARQKGLSPPQFVIVKLLEQPDLDIRWLHELLEENPNSVDEYLGLLPLNRQLVLIQSLFELENLPEAPEIGLTEYLLELPFESASRILQTVARNKNKTLETWVSAVVEKAPEHVRGHRIVNLVQRLIHGAENTSENLLFLLRNLSEEDLLRHTLSSIETVAEDDPLYQDIWQAIANQASPHLRKASAKKIQSPLLPDTAIHLIRDVELLGTREKRQILASIIQESKTPLAYAQRVLESGQNLQESIERLADLAYQCPPLRSAIRQFFLDQADTVWHWRSYANIPETTFEDIGRGLKTSLRVNKGLFPSELTWIQKSRDPRLAPYVIDFMHQADTESRALAIETLVCLGAGNAAIEIIPFLTNSEAMVRDAAAVGLDSLQKRMEQEDFWMRDPQLGLSSDPMRALIKQTRDSNQELRHIAIESLGTLGDPRGLPHLIELTRSANPKTKQAAINALSRINGR